MAEVLRRIVYQESICDSDGEGTEFHAAGRGVAPVHAWRDRHPDRMECRRWHHRVAAGLLSVDRYLEAVLRHGDVAPARRRVVDRAGRQRCARRPRPGARSGHRQGTLGVEGSRTWLCVSARRHHRGSASDRHFDEWIGRRHRCRHRRIIVVDSFPGRLAREYRDAPLDRYLVDRVGPAAGHARVLDCPRFGSMADEAAVEEHRCDDVHGGSGVCGRHHLRDVEQAARPVRRRSRE